MIPKKQYIELCIKYNDTKLFFQAFWWDALFGEQWDVMMSQIDDDKIFLPYTIEKKSFLKFIRNPHLTPYSGFAFSQADLPILRKKELAIQLLSSIPSVDLFDIDLSIDDTYELAIPEFIFNKKKTNILDLNLSAEQLYHNFKPSLQRQIKKASKNLNKIALDDIQLFYKLYQKTFEKNKTKTPIPFEAFEKLWNTCKINHCGQLLFCNDAQNQTHAALFLVYDNHTAYYLAGGTDAIYYGSGAMSYLMWHAIQTSLALNKKHFDFEGSMIESVNRFFTNFSPSPYSYYNIYQVKSKIYQLYQKLK